ncbi:MAG: AtpZ/AtpI family protein [Candidatus Margulisiibacteriota bacterium]
MSDSHHPDWGETMGYLSLVTQLGIGICVIVGGFALLGFSLDRWLQSKGIAFVVCIGLGGIAAMYYLYKTIMEMLTHENRKP